MYHSRQPAQVFILLETIFGAFDEIAKKRRIFKVETVVSMRYVVPCPCSLLSSSLALPGMAILCFASLTYHLSDNTLFLFETRVIAMWP
jgi:hypothetical protein